MYYNLFCFCSFLQYSIYIRNYRALNRFIEYKKNIKEQSNQASKIMGCSASQSISPNLHREIKIEDSVYQITQLLSSKQHSKIYKCIHQTSNVQYAIKIMNVNNHSQELIAMLQQAKKFFKGRTKNQNNHTNLLQIVDIGLIHKQLIIVMELGHCSLKDELIRQGKLTQQKSSKIAFQILLGLQQLHKSSNKCNLKLKSSDIIQRNNIYKISDYNLNEIYQKITKTSRKYKSIQENQLKGHFLQSHLKCLGSILIQMLSGKQFIKKQKEFSKSNHHEKQAYIFSFLPYKTSKECKQFLKECFDISNTGKRFTIQGLLNHQFIKNQAFSGKNIKENSSSHQKKISNTPKKANQLKYLDEKTGKSSRIGQEQTIFRNLTNRCQNTLQDEENQEKNNVYVYLNNKKQKMDHSKFNKKQARLLQTTQHNKIKDSINQDSNNISMVADDSLNISKVKMITEHSINHLEINRQIFKKPLKLLKKKLKDKKLRQAKQNSNNLSQNIYEQMGRRSISQYIEEKPQINTRIAQAYQLNYWSQHEKMIQQKQIQRLMWQEQLKNEAEIYKKQFAYRYGFRPTVGENSQLVDKINLQQQKYNKRF